MNYNIVWFDDEFNISLESIKMQFDDYGINYIGFESAEEGIKYINSNFHLLDAIVIDGNFFKNKGDTAIDDSGKALNMVVNSLQEIKYKKEIPYFILSGKVNFRERKNPLIYLLDIEKVYDKLNEEDTGLLCKAIIQNADNSPIGSLKLKYHDVFVMSAPDKLGDECFEKIVLLAQTLEELSLNGSSEDLFITIRKLLEKLFVKLSKIHVLDPDLITQKGWINGCSAFLSNRHTSYETEIDVHPVIQDSVFRLLNITQDSAHAEGGLKLRVDKYCNQNKSNYLYKSSVYLLFEILCYFDKYINEHQDLSINSAMWKKKQPAIVELSNSTETDTESNYFEGVVMQDALNYFYCDLYLLSSKYVLDTALLGKRIKIVEWVDNKDATTNKYYKYRAVKVKKLD